MSLVKVAGNASGTGTITIQAPNTNTNYTLDLPAAAGTIQLSGNAISGTTGTFSGTISGGSTIGVGGATPSASGAGITFPATQSASTDANTLDDYEEGTFTPTVSSGFTSPTYGEQAGRYTKIGRVCYFSFFLSVIGGTRNGNILNITLPFTSPNLTAGFAGAAYWAYANSGVVGSTTTNLPALYIAGNNTNILAFYDSNGSNFTGNSLATATPSFYIVGWMECA